MSVWETKKLGEVIKLEYGKPLPKESREEGGKYPAYGANGVKCWSNRYYLDRQSIIVGRKGSAGEVNLTDEKFWPLDVTYFVTYDDTQYDLAFLYHCLKHLRLTKLAKGVKPGINRNDVYQIEFAFPPLPEQKRIVAILDEAFEAIDRAIANTEKNLANSREVFGNILNLAVQGKITSQNPNDDSVIDLIRQIREKRTFAIKEKKIRTPKNQSNDETNVKPFDIPDSWKWVRLEDLTLGISDGVHQKPKYVSEGIPFVTVKNLTAGTGISFDNLNYVTRQDHEEFIKRTYPERGDILISKDGTIGVVRIIDTDVEFSIFVSVALVKPALYEINKYLALSLEASVVQSQITPKGTALKHLYLIDLRQLAIPLPPLAEQKRIVEKLNILFIQTQRLESIYRQKIAALKELKQSILQKAFTGELTADTPKTVKEKIAA